MNNGGLQCTKDPDSLHMISNLGFTLHNWFDKASSVQFELFNTTDVFLYCFLVKQ